MRFGNVSGRLTVFLDGTAVDVADASGGAFGPDVQSVYDRLGAFREWFAQADLPPGDSVDDAQLGPPAPLPRQVFAIGLNYGEHALESGFPRPDHPVVFTKYVSSFTGPVTEVALPEGRVDWEVELVVVIGSGGRHIPAERAWDHVAGLTVGQDISDRRMQQRGPAPQFGLAKSYPGFSPMGPWLVTPDEFDDPDDLELECSIDGELVQKARTSDLIFPVPELVARLSAVLPLLPGDVIFTGTPSGVGLGRTPPRYLRPGETLTSSVTGIGQLRQTFVAGV